MVIEINLFQDLTKLRSAYKSDNMIHMNAHNRELGQKLHTGRDNQDVI